MFKIKASRIRNLRLYRLFYKTFLDFLDFHVMGSQHMYILVTVTSSGILKAKQKLGRIFNSDKLGGIDFTKISKLTMCSA